MLSPVAPTSVAPQKLSERIVVDSEAASEFKKIIEEIETFEEMYQDQKVDGLDEPGVPDRSQGDDVGDNYDLPTPERFLPHVLTPCQPSVSTSATEPPSNHVAERQEDPEVQTYLPKISERSWVSCSDQWRQVSGNFKADMAVSQRKILTSVDLALWLSGEYRWISSLTFWLEAREYKVWGHRLVAKS